MSELGNGLSRRHLLKFASLTAGWFFLSRQNLAHATRSFGLLNQSSQFPIADIGSTFSSAEFSGDEINYTHHVLWDIDDFIRSKGGRPTSYETQDVVVVGGGMSGLLSAYLAREHRPLVLEQASQFGGNSRGERFGQSHFSIGAAYITVPEEGGPIDECLRDIGVKELFRHETDVEAKVLLRNHGLRSLWLGETDPQKKQEIEKFSAFLKDIYENSYPDIPWYPESSISQEALHALDRLTAADWLKKTTPEIPTHLHEYLQLYCWSSFGASLSEISAAHFLNFVASEVEGILALPGGNALIAEALTRKLLTELGPAQMRSSAFVVEIVNIEGGVEILYAEQDGPLKLVKARKAIIAAPKYVARHLIKDLPQTHARAWDSINYRAYVVANVLLERKVASQGYDIFALEGQVPKDPSYGRQGHRTWADFVFADWANHDQSEHTVLTFYRPYPFEGARTGITSEVGHKRVVNEIQAELEAVLIESGISPNAVKGIRLARWGHALPVAEPGFIANGLLDQISAPVGKAILFANQDDHVNPAFESAFAAAERAVKDL